MVFDSLGRSSLLPRKEHEQIFPKPGWVEHDPIEIWEWTQEAVKPASPR